MAQARMRTADGYDRLLITVDMLDAMVASGTIEGPTRVELIEGELVTMSPVHRAHARLTSKLNAYLRAQISGDHDVLDAVSVRLSDLNEPIPDICVVKGGGETNVVFPHECVLVIEVSETTASKDRLLKAPLYGKAGIPELWIVDLNTLETVVHRAPSEMGWNEIFSVPFANELTAQFDNKISLKISDL